MTAKRERKHEMNRLQRLQRTYLIMALRQNIDLFRTTIQRLILSAI